MLLSVYLATCVRFIEIIVHIPSQCVPVSCCIVFFKYNVLLGVMVNDRYGATDS